MLKSIHAQMEVGASERDRHARRQAVQMFDARGDGRLLSTPRKSGR
jgi:hypothetical protein